MARLSNYQMQRITTGQRLETFVDWPELNSAVSYSPLTFIAGSVPKNRLKIVDPVTP